MCRGILRGEWLGKRSVVRVRRRRQRKRPQKRRSKESFFFGVNPCDRYLFLCFHTWTVRKTTYKIVVTFRVG
jgi:hypothetical protein